MFTYDTLGNCCTIQTKREQARHGGDSGDGRLRLCCRIVYCLAAGGRAAFR